MKRRIATCLLALVITANAAAVLLYSGDGPVETPSINPLGNAGAWHPILKTIAEGLTLPIRTANIADVRDGIILIALGLGLILLSIRTIRDRHPSEPTGKTSRFRNEAERWLGTTAAAVLIISILSATANHRFDLSQGWIIRFAAGAGWAILIARSFNGERVRRATLGLLIVALICLVLTLAHRADRGLAHFTWPIGPITPTAAFAALWAGLAIALSMACLLKSGPPESPVAPVSNRCVSRSSSPRPGDSGCAHRRFGPATMYFLFIAVISIFVLQQTHRRAPVMGLIAGVLVSGAALLWTRYRSRRAGTILAGTGLAAILIAAGYVAMQLRSADTEASGALGLRFAYWRIAGTDLIPNHLSLGSGPDTFVVEMTRAVAPLRAVSPHFYHGNINYYAHNEWIQAAVELGIPGALFHLALPLGVMVLSGRRLITPARHAGIGDDRRCLEPPDASTRASLLALIAGLTTIIVTESASITLRGPMMPVWYWTLLGLLAALNRERIPAPKTIGIAISPPIRVLAFLALGLCCLAVALTDLNHARTDTNPFAPLEQRGRDRLYANKTIVARQQTAVFASALAQAKKDEGNAASAVTRWRDLYELIPAFRDTSARYAEALLIAKRQDEARGVLAQSLNLDPYNPATNTLYAELHTDDPVIRLRCVRRALRNAELNDTLRSILADISDQPAVAVLLDTKLPPARAAATQKTPPAKTDDPAEWLRIAAFLESQSGNIDQALADQRLAADYCAFLEQTNNPYRRGHNAETDVVFTQ
ncbi:MAG: O-antigen ligase family protein, partial [Phycisphaerae bacterium]